MMRALEHGIGTVLQDDNKGNCALQYFCKDCEVVVRSICQLYLELHGIHLRLSWKLGEFGKLLKLNLKGCPDSVIEEEDQLNNYTDGGSSLEEDKISNNWDHARKLLKRKCIQKGKEYQCVPVPTAIQSFRDDEDLDTPKWKGVAEHFSDVEGTLDVEENGSGSGSDWCPSDNDDVPVPRVKDEDSDDERGNVAFSDLSENENENSPTSTKKKKRRNSQNKNTNPNKKRRGGRPFSDERTVPTWDCELCGPTTYLRIPHLQKHELTISTKKFPCWFCYKSFALQQSLDHHVKTWHPKKLSNEGNFLCHVDGCQGFDSNPQQSFDTIPQLNEHLKKTHLISDGVTDIQSCSTCGLGFTDENLLKLHELLHIKPISDGKTRHIICPVCGKAVLLGDLSSIQDHYNHYHGVFLRNHKCAQCGTPCASVKALRTHLKVYHSGKIKSPKKLSRGPESCQECGKEVKNKTRLEKHKRRAHKPVSCEICGENFVGLDSLKEHRIKVHKFRDYTNGEEGESHFCSVCKKTLPSRIRLQQHMSEVHVEPKFKCGIGICRKVYKKLYTLKEHQKKSHAVDDDHSHICPHCPKTFLLRTCLTTHLGTVHPEMTTTEGFRGKIHDCPNCPEKFRRKIALHRHIIKNHSEGELADGMLECNVCKLRMPIGKRDKMEFHMSTHLTMEERRSGGKLHMCHVCGKEFRTAWYYKEHLKMHEKNNASKVSSATETEATT